MLNQTNKLPKGLPVYLEVFRQGKIFLKFRNQVKSTNAKANAVKSRLTVSARKMQLKALRFL